MVMPWLVQHAANTWNKFHVSSDGMTADWYDFEPAFLRRVSTRICNKVKGVNRVVYDITSKPPGTIEWE